VPSEVRWRVHLASPPAAVWELLATDKGRARFWAESTSERDGAIEFVFPNGERYEGQVIAADASRRFEVDYFGTPARFSLEPDGAGGTELTLVHDVEPEWHAEVNAGWVSVLMALKAVSDYGVDLRNHDAERTWWQGYCDN
jgi:uncharacterized protein YndB with AHSA1/START domain